MPVEIESAGPAPESNINYSDGSVDASSEAPENDGPPGPLLHRPHAFALMHGGETGAKVAYGELHWAIDVLIANFKTTTISVNDHCDHSHEPHDDHTDHSHAPHDSHTHVYEHSHTTNVNGATTTGDANPINTSASTSSSSGIGTTYTSDGHVHPHSHFHSISQHNHTTVSQIGTVTDGPSAALTHSGVKAPNGTDTAAGTVLGHTDHSGVKDTDGTTTAPDCVLKHSLTIDGVASGIGSSATIEHVDSMGQQAIPEITQQVPNIDTEDGDPMTSQIPNEYFQLTGYGDVYLVWKVDLELSPVVQKCWVQVGDPGTSPISGTGIGSAITDRLDNSPENSSTEGTYRVKLGSVTNDNRIKQEVSSDVCWRPVVLDRTHS